MKKLLSCIICILLSTLLISALPVDGEEKLYDNVIRLHIIANSNSDEDQELKLKIRDEILMRYSERLASVQSIERAEEEVLCLLEDIRETARKVCEREGYDYAIEIDLGTEYYPTREYGELHFPAGNYTSLRVIVGEGEGKNWWCVLFPPLCVSTAYGDTIYADDSVPVGLTPEQYRIISKSDDVKYVVKFKVLELLEGLVGH